MAKKVYALQQGFSIHGMNVRGKCMDFPGRSIRVFLL